MPTQAGTHVDYPNSELMLMRVINGDKEYISQDLSVRIPVERDSDSYFIINNAGMGIGGDERSANAEASTVDWDASLGYYKAQRYAKKHEINIDVYNNAVPSLKAQFRTIAATRVTNNLLINMEYRASVLYSTGTNYPSANRKTLSGTSRWDDYDNSNPIQDIIDGWLQLLKSGGKNPNVFAIDIQTWSKLAQNPKVKSYLPNIVIQSITTDMLMAILNGFGMAIEKILIAKSTYNTANDNQTESFDFIWPKFALLAFVDNNAKTIMDLTLGKTFIPNDLSGLQIENYTLPQKKIITVEGNIKYMHAIVYNKVGYIFITPIS